MRAVRLDIEFDHEGPLLTQGPGRPYSGQDDHLSSIGQTLKARTGGYVNANQVTPPPRGRIMSFPDPDGDRKRHYAIIFFLPPVAGELFRRDGEAFWELSGMNWWVKELGLTDLKGSLYE